jgi:hypothetical protein
MILAGWGGFDGRRSVRCSPFFSSSFLFSLVGGKGDAVVVSSQARIRELKQDEEKVREDDL